MSDNNLFDWVDFYKEFADKLLFTMIFMRSYEFKSHLPAYISFIC